MSTPRTDALLKTFTPSTPFTTVAMALEKHARELEGALTGLVERLELIHTDPAYQSAWTCFQNHCGPYQGPRYDKELKAAKDAIGEKGVCLQNENAALRAKLQAARDGLERIQRQSRYEGTAVVGAYELIGGIVQETLTALAAK